VNVANPYIVTVLVYDKSGATEEHVLRIEAYSVTDVMYQAGIELEAKYALAEHRKTMRLVSITPDTATARARTRALLEEIGLLHLPTTGSKS
jgi:hypothetical protein